MITRVVDASYLLSVLFPDEVTDKDVYERFLSGEVALIAPVLLGLEVSNAILLASRRKRVSGKRANQLVKLFLGLPIIYKDVDLGETFLLASELGLTVYDANYVWLARKMKVELLTHDKKMFRGRTS